MRTARCGKYRFVYPLNLWIGILTLAVSVALRVDEGLAGNLELECYPTFESIGLRLHYQGNVSDKVQTEVNFRQDGTAGWRKALPLSPISGNRFAGSIFFLTPGTRYEVRVTLTGEPGTAGAAVSRTVTTRAEKFPQGASYEYYVDPAGDDAGRGMREMPFKTIGKAAAAATSGDIVHVNPGIYREEVVLKKSGRPDAYISFVAEGRNVVITGADSMYDGMDSEKMWQDQGGGVFMTGPGYLTRYVACRGVRLYHYLTRGEFDRFICGAPGGWFQDKNTKMLYVRLEPLANPGELEVQLAGLETGFTLAGADYILIDGFEIRHFGRETQGAGVALMGASWNVIRNCSIHGMNSIILLDHDGDRDAEGNLVLNCELWDTSIPAWPWAMVKGHDEEGGGVISRGGRGNVVRGCVLHGLFDGLAPSAWEEYSNERYNCDWDVCDNEITNIRDDVIEPEGPCINFRFWNNYCHEVFAGVSLAPIFTGPVYVLYNVIHDHDYLSIKYNGVGPGVCHLYHNTIYSNYKESDALRTSDQMQGQILRNNVFFADGLAVNAYRTPLKNNDIDYDLWFNLDSRWLKSYTESLNPRMFQFADKLIYSIEELTRQTGWEAHGMFADPRLAAPERGDFRLLPSSPCIDSGQRLPNINDDFRGSAPDLGAFERGSAASGHFPLGLRRN